jgi:hypothetical protein
MIIVGAGIERLDQVPLVIAGRQHDGVSHRTRGRTAHRAAQPDAVESGHQQIGDENVDRALSHHLERRLAVGHRADLETLRLQQPRHADALRLGVLGEHHAQLRSLAAGRGLGRTDPRLRRRLAVVERQQFRGGRVAGLDVELDAPLAPRRDDLLEQRLEARPLDREALQQRAEALVFLARQRLLGRDHATGDHRDVDEVGEALRALGLRAVEHAAAHHRCHQRRRDLPVGEHQPGQLAAADVEHLALALAALRLGFGRDAEHVAVLARVHGGERQRADVVQQAERERLVAGGGARLARETVGGHCGGQRARPEAAIVELRAAAVAAALDQRKAHRQASHALEAHAHHRVADRHGGATTVRRAVRGAQDATGERRIHLQRTRELA